MNDPQVGERWYIEFGFGIAEATVLAVYENGYVLKGHDVLSFSKIKRDRAQMLAPVPPPPKPKWRLFNKFPYLWT